MSGIVNPLIAQNISFAYKTREVVSNISFRVDPGEFLIIIGPNGSGKSTLLKILAGLLQPQSGHIEIMGRSLHEFSRVQLAQQIAFVPQTTALNFPFTVGQMVLMGRAPYLGWPPIESKDDWRSAQNAMAYTGVEHLADRSIGEISGGEQQRVFLARALCQSPKVLLLDEPTAALDLSHQVAVMDLLERLTDEQQMTVIMISHDLNLAAMYAQRILLMNSGVVVRIGIPETVLHYELLESVYGCSLLVDRSPIGDYPRIHLVPRRHSHREKHHYPSEINSYLDD